VSGEDLTPSPEKWIWSLDYWIGGRREG